MDSTTVVRIVAGLLAVILFAVVVYRRKKAH
jgi:LPXTG-motif cell wall-anchored protein